MKTAQRPLLLMAVAMAMTLTGSCAWRTVDSCNFSKLELSLASEEAFVDAVADIGDFICSETSGNEALTIDVPVAAAAVIIAEDVVGIALRCMTHTNNSPLTETPAGFVGAAFAHALHNARVCMLCPQKLDHMVSAAVDSIDEAIRGSLSKPFIRRRPVTESQQTLVHSLEKDIEAGLLAASQRIQSSSVQGCHPSSHGGSAVLRSMDPGPRRKPLMMARSFSACTATSRANASIVANDAVAALIVDTRAFACDNSTATDSFDTTLTATATALVEAVATVDARCETQGGPGTMGCAMGRANIRAVARAQAEAFATGFAQAGTCFCNETISVNTSQFGQVFAEASAEAFGRACSSGTNSSSVSITDHDIDEQTVTAVVRVIAAAVAQAQDGSGECAVDTSACAAISSQCARRNTRCRGEGVEGTLPCCSSDYVCTRRSSKEARCLPEGAPIPVFFDGRIDAPTVEVEIPSQCADL